MKIRQILRQKNAGSLVVGIVLALFLSQLVTAWSIYPVAWLSPEVTSGRGWSGGLWEPFITFVIEVVILEIVLRIGDALLKSSKKKK